ncbi:Cu(I)-responsive transcriptional regulator [Vibrio sp. AK197]|uniref:HTH-type transcriptional regulator CueR n=1 Tax=Vibrio olivae TaxID=1243002 RepID=A0ABV5HPT5_9VIBR
MNIGAISEMTGLSSKSIRMYEEKGIITPPPRSESGYREYTPQHVQELNLVSRAKSAGFSLAECRELVDLAHNPQRQSRDVKLRAEVKLHEIEEKIHHLQEIEKQLKLWVSACPGDTNSHCPIIEELTKTS